MIPSSFSVELPSTDQQDTPVGGDWNENSYVRHIEHIITNTISEIPVPKDEVPCLF